MTPRLKILIAGLALSLIYAVYDYIDRNSNKPVAEKKREEKIRDVVARRLALQRRKLETENTL